VCPPSSGLRFLAADIIEGELETEIVRLARAAIRSQEAKTISHYKVLEKIGQSGMGEVYRVEDTNLSRDVAIKVLPEQFTKDPQRLARFERGPSLFTLTTISVIRVLLGQRRDYCN